MPITSRLLICKQFHKTLQLHWTNICIIRNEQTHHNIFAGDIVGSSAHNGE